MQYLKYKMHSIGLISDHILGMFNNRLDNTKKNGKPEDTAMEIVWNRAQRKNKITLNDEKVSMTCGTIPKSLTYMQCDFQKKTVKIFADENVGNIPNLIFLKNYELINPRSSTNSMRNKHKKTT